MSGWLPVWPGSGMTWAVNEQLPGWVVTWPGRGFGGALRMQRKAARLDPLLYPRKVRAAVRALSARFPISISNLAYLSNHTACRYAPGVEAPMFAFHQLLHADLA